MWWEKFWVSFRAEPVGRNYYVTFCLIANICEVRNIEKLRNSAKFLSSKDESESKFLGGQREVTERQHMFERFGRKKIADEIKVLGNRSNIFKILIV